MSNVISWFFCRIWYYKDGEDFINTCGIDASEESTLRVASVPNLVFSLISLEKHDLFMKIPIIRRAIVKPISFCGDWLVKCLADKRLMEGAIEFFELVSKDIDTKDRETRKNQSTGGSSKQGGLGEHDDDDFATAVMKNTTFEQMASIDHLVSPMLKLPHRLQDRIASTKVNTTFDWLLIDWLIDYYYYY